MPYKTLAEDTLREGELFRLNALRQAGMIKRVAIATAHTKAIQHLCLSGLKRRETELAVIRQKFSRALLGFNPSFELRSNPNVWADHEPFGLAQELHVLFERIAVDYFVTGGVAACCHGDPRSTSDLDVVIKIEREDIDILAQVLTGNGFYVPPINLENVMEGHERCLNITHIEQCTNADLIVSAKDPFDWSQMERRVLVEPGFYICSAEDTILQKLRWTAQSFSEKQWRDVQAILRIQGDTLDIQYLNHWATIINVQDRLNEAFSDSEMMGDS